MCFQGSGKRNFTIQGVLGPNLFQGMVFWCEVHSYFGVVVVCVIDWLELGLVCLMVIGVEDLGWDPCSSVGVGGMVVCFGLVWKPGSVSLLTILFMNFLNRNASMKGT